MVHHNLLGASDDELCCVTASQICRSGPSPVMAEDTRRSSIRVLAGFASFGLFWGTWGSVLPILQANAHVNNGKLGVALLMIGLGALVSMRLTGSLLDRFGRPVVVATLVLFGAIGFLPALAHGLVILSAFTFLLGVASGATDVCINALAVDHEAATQRKILNSSHAIFSIFVVVSSLGIAVLRSVGLPLWELLLCSQSVIILLTLLVMPSREPWHPRPVAPRSATGRRRRAVPQVLVVLGTLGAVAYLLENAWQSWGAILLQDGVGAGPGLSSAVPAVFAVMAATGRLLGDPVARRVAPRVLLAGGAAVAAVGSVLAAHAPGAGLAILGIAISGFGTSVCAPTIISLAGAAITRLGRAAAVSTVTTFSYLGFLVGPPLVGLIADRSSLPSAMTFVAVLAALLSIAALVVPGIPSPIRADRASGEAGHTGTKPAAMARSSSRSPTRRRCRLRSLLDKRRAQRR